MLWTSALEGCCAGHGPDETPDEEPPSVYVPDSLRVRNQGCPVRLLIGQSPVPRVVAVAKRPLAGGYQLPIVRDHYRIRRTSFANYFEHRPGQISRSRRSLDLGQPARAVHF